MQYMVSPANTATTAYQQEAAASATSKSTAAVCRPSAPARPTALLLTRLDRKAMGRPRLWSPSALWQASCQLLPIFVYTIRDIEPIHPEGNIDEFTNLHVEVSSGRPAKKIAGKPSYLNACSAFAIRT